MRFLPTAATGLLHAKKVNLSHNQPRNSNRIAATFRCDLSDQIGWKINVIKIKLRYFLATNIMLICWEFSSKTWWYIYIYAIYVCMYVYIHMSQISPTTKSGGTKHWDVNYSQVANHQGNLQAWSSTCAANSTAGRSRTSMTVENRDATGAFSLSISSNLLFISSRKTICFSPCVGGAPVISGLLTKRPWGCQGLISKPPVGEILIQLVVEQIILYVFWCFWDDLSSWILHEIHEWNIWNGGILHWNWNPNLDQCQAYVGSSWESCMNSELTNIGAVKTTTHHPILNFVMVPRSGTRALRDKAAENHFRTKTVSNKLNPVTCTAEQYWCLYRSYH